MIGKSVVADPNFRFLCQHRALLQGGFLPLLKKLKGAFKKTQDDFWRKTQGYGGNFGYQEKAQYFSTKASRILSKVQRILIHFEEFSQNLSNLCGIFLQNKEIFQNIF